MSSESDTHRASQCTAGLKRIKRWHAKVRSGCKTCRVRRVKCDEAKPECARCSRRDLTCIYDRLAPAKIDDNALQNQRLSLYDAGTQSVLYTDGLFYCLGNLNASRGNPEEQRFLQYYLSGTTSRFTSSSSPAIFNHLRLVFLTLVPQIAQTSQAVRHAISAAASAEENLMQPRDTSRWLARRQYHHCQATVQAILKADLAIEELLLCCVLLFSYSCYVRDFKAAGLHLHSGLRLIEEKKKCSESPILFAVETALKDLEPTLSLIFQNSCPRATFEDSTTEQMSAALEFTNEEEAHLALRMLVECMVNGQLEGLKSQFFEWHNRFKASQTSFKGVHAQLVARLYNASTFVYRFITAPSDTIVSETRRYAIDEQLRQIIREEQPCMLKDVSMLQDIVRSVTRDNT